MSHTEEITSGKVVSCEVCHKDFYVWPSRLKKNKHHTCSRKCSGELRSKIRSKKVKTNCVECGKEIFYKKSAYEKITIHTCSVKCMSKNREKRYLGKTNPNKKYHFDPFMFQNIDSEYKAYFLGFTASDGHIKKDGIHICIKNTDKLLLGNLRDGICKDIPLKNKKNNMINLSINSKEMADTFCKIFNISPGKKAFTVNYPDISENMHKHFIRGVFDGDGCVISPGKTKNYPVCTIVTGSKHMAEGIKQNSPFTPKLKEYKNKLGNPEFVLSWYNNTALDFLSWIYDDSDIYLHRKKDLYRDWSVWVPSLSGRSNGKTDHFRWVKADKDAVGPTKTRASDSGYDVTIIKKIKDFDTDTKLYDTGIKVQPFYGWWFLLAGRSSLAKLGYELATNIGVIDRSYIGTILVALRKTNPHAPDLKLPLKVAQLIPMPIIHVKFEQVTEFEDTERGSGGFGSTDG